MFALSSVGRMGIFCCRTIWTIGFLKAILKNNTYSDTNESITKESMCMQRSILDCKNQWKEEVVVRRNVEIKTVYGLVNSLFGDF